MTTEHQNKTGNKTLRPRLKDMKLTETEDKHETEGTEWSTKGDQQT